jgi:hypothetical protein
MSSKVAICIGTEQCHQLRGWGVVCLLYLLAYVLQYRYLNYRVETALRACTAAAAVCNRHFLRTHRGAGHRCQWHWQHLQPRLWYVHCPNNSNVKRFIMLLNL